MIQNSADPFIILVGCSSGCDDLFNIGQKVDLIGESTDSPIENSLFAQINSLKPTEPCFIKVMARIVGSMTPMHTHYDSSGSSPVYEMIDPYNGNYIKETVYTATRASSDKNDLAMKAAYKYITDPLNWTSFSC
jgi:hypothetical protein